MLYMHHLSISILVLILLLLMMMMSHHDFIYDRWCLNVIYGCERVMNECYLWMDKIIDSTCIDDEN